MANAIPYVPRHLAPLPGGLDVSAHQRHHVDRVRAGMAVVALCKTLATAESSRTLWREFRRSGALRPELHPSRHISALGIAA